MKKQHLVIKGIPAVIWGENTGRVWLAVHGNRSHKEDTVIALLAERAVKCGFQVLSFDLPAHGARKQEQETCRVQQAVRDLKAVMVYARAVWREIRLFSCSLGVYFSLLAYPEEPIAQCLFLSPVVDMERMICNMMTWFGVDESRLAHEKEIPTPAGETLYWDYFCYVKAHPVVKWPVPTAILYGTKDALCEMETISQFASRFGCDLDLMEGGEHYFHTEEQLAFFERWVQKTIPVTET